MMKQTKQSKKPRLLPSSGIFLFTTENHSQLKNIKLNGTKISATQIDYTYSVIKRLSRNLGIGKTISKTIIHSSEKDVTFELKEISGIEIQQLWKRKAPSLIIKIEGKLYYTAIPSWIKFYDSKILGPHLCANCTRATSFNCEKVLRGAEHIESYPWISDGYESIFTTVDSFIVCTCKYYMSPKK